MKNFQCFQYFHCFHPISVQLVFYSFLGVSGCILRFGYIVSGRKISVKSSGKYIKNPRNPKISRIFGGDKRDRTADLLNAIGSNKRSHLAFSVFLCPNSPFSYQKVLYFIHYVNIGPFCFLSYSCCRVPPNFRCTAVFRTR